MKIREKFDKLPVFLREDRIKVPTTIILLSLILLIVLTFIADWKIGLTVVLLILVTVWLLYNSTDYLIEETNKYVSDLSYRIKKGEQEALIQMPIGILLYNEKYEIQWTKLKRLTKSLQDGLKSTKPIKCKRLSGATVILKWLYKKK